MRVVHQQDALEWLRGQRLRDCSLVASLPDCGEFPTLTLSQWASWFQEAAELVLRSCPEDGVTFFYQTDVKHEGRWIDKSYLCQKAAESAGHALLFHKIVCRCPPGCQTTGKPGYGHLLCFAAQLRADPSEASVDVIPERGESTWVRGMGRNVCELIARFVLKHTRTRTIVNPFCGEGLLLAVANSLGLDAVGIERSRKRALRAQKMEYAPVS